MSGFAASFWPQFWATISGVIAGSLLTFTYERRKAKNEQKLARETSEQLERERRAAVVNRTILQLGRMRAEITEYKIKAVDPVRNTGVEWALLNQDLMRVNAPSSFDYAGLQFLLLGPDVDLVSEIELQETRFARLLWAIKRRAELHSDEFQRRLDAIGVGAAPTPMEEIVNAAGPRLYHQMRDLTETIIDYVDKDGPLIRLLEQKLHKAAKPLVGQERIVVLADNAEPIP